MFSTRFSIDDFRTDVLPFAVASPREFDGEDPLLPLVREVLDKTRQDLAELHLLLDFVDAEVELPEPDEERVAELRERLLGHEA